jgi:hypothetical protein
MGSVDRSLPSGTVGDAVGKEPLINRVCYA